MIKRLINSGRRILACLLAVILSASLLCCPAFAENTESDDWTILVYICGSNLESKGFCASDDIDEMLAAGLPGNINVIIETGGANSWWNKQIQAGTIGRFAVENDELVTLQTLPDADMGDPGTLESFISWGLENYPAKRTGLILWNHGGGITGACFDETRNNSNLSLLEIQSAVANTVDGRFEFIGFDACLMATLETASLLSPYAHYMFASEEVEPGTGWSYTSLLSFLAETPDADGAALGYVQCESYFESTGGNEPDSSATFSVIDLDRLEDFSLAFDRTAQELVEGGRIHAAAYTARLADSFGSNNKYEGYCNLVDVADFLKGVADKAPSAASALEALEECVIYNYTSAKHANCGGLSMFYPLGIDDSATVKLFNDTTPAQYYRELVGTIVAEGMEMTSGASTGGLMGDIGDKNCPLDVASVVLDDEGSLIVTFNDLEMYAYASCTVFQQYIPEDSPEETFFIYIGEDDNAYLDEDNNTLRDNFNGCWVYLDGTLLPLTLVDFYDTKSEYTCPVILNGEEINLRIVYDTESGSFSVPGTWDGYDEQSGMASRDVTPLEDGDELTIIYSFVDDYGDWFSYEGESFTVDGPLSLEYDLLEASDYAYALNVYDIYGNVWSTSYVYYVVDEDGSVYFYPAEPEGTVEVPNIFGTGTHTEAVESTVIFGTGASK